MAVPENIRKVPRPVNTIVEDNGREGPNRYAVRERHYVKYVAGGNPQPRNGKVIGHITDGVFVPIRAATASQGPDMLSYGGAAFVKSVSGDLLRELLSVYPAKDAYTIMAVASLKILKPGIAANRYGTHYRLTYVSKYYPGVALSENTVCKFLQKLGQDGSKRREFYHQRALAVAQDHHIAIDGMLKQDTSTVNDLSEFSYKARVKGCKEVSVLYAYDIEAMEPICAEVFPGNSIDAGSYNAFIRGNDIRKGLIISDKGFPPKRIQEELKDRPELHFLTPIKRNDVRIANHCMLQFEGVLEGVTDHVLYKKADVKGGHFLYSFKAAKKESAEASSYLSIREKQKDFSPENYQKKKELFGVIVFESDLDMDPKTAYLSYEDRWLLELVFKHYKNDECLDQTNVQGDFSLIGAEFINFISTVLTCRLIRKAREARLLDKMSFGSLMDDLNSSWRQTSENEDDPHTDDGKWVHTLANVFESLEALNLSVPIPKPAPKKRGRPRTKPDVVKPKRPRGRPRKTDAPAGLL